MTRAINTSTPRLLFALLAAFMLTGLWMMVGPAAPSHASCGIGQMCDGTGSDPDPDPGSQPGSGKPAPRPPAGSGGPVDPYLVIETSTYGPTINSCPTKDGRKAKGAWMYYRWEFDKTSSRTTPPPSFGWQWVGSFSDGHHWKRLMFQKKVCAYPALTAFKTIKCSISYSVRIDMARPDEKTLGSQTRNTGYRENSNDYNACYSSKGSVDMTLAVNEYGFYQTYTWQRVQNVRVEYTVKKDEWTGAWPAPKIVGHSPAYDTVPKLGMTGSLDCKNGWKSPGLGNLKGEDFTSNPCKGGEGKAPFTCSVPNGVWIDGNDDTPVQMRKVAPGSPIQMNNNGKGREIRFDQRISGPGLTVNSYSTQFIRSGSPWNSSIKDPNKNLVELAQSANGPGILANASGTGKIPGNDKSVFLRGYQASDPGKDTTVTQKLGWTGTQRIQSVKITSINPNTGQIVTAPITVIVPTSGSCSQSVDIQYLRSVGSSR